jgi:hypothetical protein
MMEKIKASPAYEGIDIDREFAKMQIWCTKHRKVATIQRFINWLNRCDKPMDTDAQYEVHL